MTYVSWSEGFKSGGFNQRYNAAPPGNAPISFDAETAESFEFGLKLNPTDTLRVNAAVFTTDYDDIQMTYRLGVVPLLFNAGVASIDGGSSSSNSCRHRTSGSMPASATWMRVSTASRRRRPSARSRRLPPPRSNSRLPFTPEWQGHLGSSYAFHLGANVAAHAARGRELHGAAVLRRRQFGGDRADRRRHAGECFAGARNRGRKWRIVLSGNNLTDELYPVAGTSSLTTASGYAEIIYARPRSVAVSVTRNF